MVYYAHNCRLSSSIVEKSRQEAPKGSNMIRITPVITPITLINHTHQSHQSHSSITPITHHIHQTNHTHHIHRQEQRRLSVCFLALSLAPQLLQSSPCLGNGAAHTGLSLFISTNLVKIIPQTDPQTKLMWAISL